MVRSLFLSCVILFTSVVFAESAMLQQRAEDGAVTQLPFDWAPEETAIVVCDMWDQHWCKGATARVAEMAPTMDRVLRIAREQGILILHAPSDTLDFYADTPQRKRAQEAPRAKRPSKDIRDRYRDFVEPPLPIDDSDGGCNCTPSCTEVNQRKWSRQIDTIHIGAEDIIAQDHSEVYNVLKAEGRDNVIVMGVHTNMCVLNRPFAIRAQVKNGMNVALMRDLTDTMYNHRMAPFVNHHRGTDLVVQHIESTWCPTLTSSAFTGEAPFRFQSDERPHVAFILHEDEYDATRTVPEFAEAELAAKLGWRCTYLFGDGLHNIPGLSLLEDADLMVVYARRQVLTAAQLQHIREYCEAGKPVIGLRTASHAFSPRGKSLEGHEAWVSFDPEILGGNYRGHHGNKGEDDPKTMVWAVPGQEKHPVLDGVDLTKRPVPSWLYKVLPLENSATPLVMGALENKKDKAEPVVWVNTGKWGNRVFSTTLGHADEFQDGNFRTLLVNGMQWALAQDTSKAEN